MAENQIIVCAEEEVEYKVTKLSKDNSYTIIIGADAKLQTHPWMAHPTRGSMSWTDDKIRRFWLLCELLNWCGRDIDGASNYNFAKARRWISGNHRSDTEILATGYYYMTMGLYPLLTDLFEKYNYDEKHRYQMTGHLVLMGQEYYNRACEDISWYEPFIELKSCANFESAFRQAAYYGLEYFTLCST